MKKKNKTYALLAVVLGIWGVIIFKFVGALNPSSESVAETTSNEVFVPKEVKERELFALALDYRDPFLGTVDTPRKKVTKAKKNTSPKVVVPTKSIQFTGFIQQKNSKQNIFFITVDGQQQLMKINDTFQKVKLVKGSKSSIRVTYDGKTENIELTK